MPTTKLQNAGRVALGLMLMTAGTGHLSFFRKEFQAQVPDMVTDLLPMSKDDVVVDSGYVEIALGLATLLAGKRLRAPMGWALAGFFAAVFPGNIGQYLDHRYMPGLDSDNKRLGRLFFQPVLMAWALWSTGALQSLLEKKEGSIPANEAAEERAG